MQDRTTGIIFGLGLPQVIFYGVFALAAAAMLVHYMRSEKPVRTALWGMLSGTAALLILHGYGNDIPYLTALPLNGLTAFISVTLGIPGVAAMEIISMII